MEIDKSNIYNISSANSFSLKGVQYQKLIKSIEKAPQLKKLKITFDELERMYNELGYDVIRKRGSHAIVQLTENINIPVIISHGSKYVHFNDLKRFLLIKNHLSNVILLSISIRKSIRWGLFRITKYCIWF